MTTLTEYHFYKRFKVGEQVNYSSVPKTVLRSAIFSQLLSAGILEEEKAGKGRIIKIKKMESFQSFFGKTFPEENEALFTKADSVKLLRDSKKFKNFDARSFYLLRGNVVLSIGEEKIDLGYFTENFGAFLINDLTKLDYQDLAIIENKYFFENSYKIIDSKFVCMHKYGRWSKDDFEKINVKGEIIFCGDYDLIGLDEYLKFKEVNPAVKLFIPDNFEEYFNKYAKMFDSSINFNQNMSERLSNSKDPLVLKIRDMVVKNNSFLEQEALL